MILGTNDRSIRVELFFTAGCAKCAEARDSLRQAAQSAGAVEWTEVDIGKNSNRAVDVGVVSTPAVAIDGELVFSAMPSPSELKKAIEGRVANR